jgi:hypothetical protein
VEEDAAWHGEDGTAESAKNHRLWDKGASRQGRFITKLVLINLLLQFGFFSYLFTYLFDYLCYLCYLHTYFFTNLILLTCLLSRMGGAEAAAEQEMEENMQSVGGMLANLR